MSFLSLLEAGKLKEAKLSLRESLGPNQRKDVWKKILELRTSGVQLDTSSLYWDTVDTCYGSRDLPRDSSRLPGCVDTCHTHVYSLGPDDKARVSRLVTVLSYNCPDIPYIPLIYPVTAILLVAGFTEEEAYEVIAMMVAPPRDQNINYFTQTRGGWDVLCFSLTSLANKYIFLESEFGKEDSDELFQNWPWWIFQDLSQDMVLRVMDCFFFEGHKVLFRVALAKLKLFYKSVSDKKELYQDAKKDGLYSAFSSHSKNLSVSPDELLKIAFKFPRFSKADIAKLTAKLDTEAKANRLKRTGRRTRSSEDLGDAGPRHQAATFSTPQHRPAGAYPVHHLVSEILSKEQILALWDELPERIISVKPTLAYSSNEHGVSMTTFFTRVDKYEPSIMVIRTSDMEVLGAYCSASWAERNQKDDKGLRQRYFGTGETFVFKFDKGSMISKFEWVNKDQSDDEDESRKRDVSKELFMSADRTMITVGGGNGTAIFLDENLRFGQTEKCDTFDNPPLCSKRDFSINTIEVYGFVDISW